MKAKSRKTTNLVIGAMLVVAALAIAFWVLLLSPEREEADKLSGRIQTVEASLTQHRSEAQAATAAKRSFSRNYERLVVLGKAVPGDSETASLLVQVNQIAAESGVKFEALTLNGATSETEAPPPAPSPGAAVSPTEAAASLLPLGASIGPAGLAVMPYSLTFQGDFFKIADFIEGLDKLVMTTNANVAVDGRLITVGGFSLEAGEGGFPNLQGTFSVTTFLTPPGQGLTDGASPAGPEAEVATLTSTTTGGAP